MSKDVKQSVAAQFGAVADNYRTSQVHATGTELATMRDIVSRFNSPLVLDAGCGAGHTAVAVAPVSQQVVAYDLSAEMLSQVVLLAAEKGIDNIVTEQGDVEKLPFDDHTFDVVVSRYSAHHWPNPAAALREIRRVLKPGGPFLLCDIVGAEVPVVDTFLQTIELLRDPSHVRDHTISEWERMLTSAEFTPTTLAQWPLPLQMTRWTTRMATPPDQIAMIRKLLAGAPAEVKTTFQLQPDEQFVIFAALFEASQTP